jgi:hypothetical protein
MQDTQHIQQTLDIVNIVETNPKIKLSSISRNKLIDKLTHRFNDNEQQLFLANFYCYLNHHDNDYIIDLEKIWKWLGFSRIDTCKRVLLKHFKKDIDYKIVLRNLAERKNEGGHNKETILMNIDTFKKLCLKANTKKADEIHNYYIILEKVLNEILYEETTELQFLLENAQKKLELYEKRPSTFGFDYNSNKNGYVYIISDISKTGHYKIGMANDAEKRLRNLNTSSSEKSLRIIYKIETYNPELLEKTIQNVLQPFNIRGRREWFYFIDEKELNYAIDVFISSHSFTEQFNIQSSYEFASKIQDINWHLDNINQDTNIQNEDINETNIYKLNAQTTLNRTGRYKGVCWCVEKEKWKSELKRDYVNYFLGYYDDDTDAAKAYNNFAHYFNTTNNANYVLNKIDEIDYCPIPQNIPELNRLKFQNEKTSMYNGVFFCKSRNTFYTSIKHMGKSYYLGASNNEKECAMLYNKQAAYFNQIDGNANYILNEQFDKTPENILKTKIENYKDNKSSQYYGVNWSKQRKKWRAVIVVNKKQIHLGFYDDELDAAIAYNNYAIEQNKIKTKNNNNKNLWKINDIHI